MKNNAFNIELKNPRDYSSKEKFGKTYWDERRAIAQLQNAEKHEEAKRWFRNIVENSPIRKIVLDINGSGDSGAIDDVSFYDVNRDYIYPKYHIGKINIPHMDKGNTVTEPFKEHWEYQDYQITYIQALELLKRYIAKGQVIDAEWIKSEAGGEYDSTQYTIVKDNKDNKQVWKSWDCDSQYKLEFPDIKASYFYLNTSKHVLEEMVEYAYTLLPGGWEINEGSTSEIIYEYCGPEIDKENGIEYEDKHFHVDVKYTQYEYSEETHEWKLNSDKELHKIVTNFLENNKLKDRKLNLENKRHNELFYKLVEEVSTAVG